MSRILEEPTCAIRRCRHFRGVTQAREGDEAGEVPYCAAFPDGIPRMIAYGPNKHLRPVEGDRGIRFEELPPGKDVTIISKAGVPRLHSRRLE